MKHNPYADVIRRVRIILCDPKMDELRKPQYRGNTNLMVGHCYIACEAVYHITGKRLKPCVMRVPGGTHWFLKAGETVYDPTYDQFESMPDYSLGRGCGFLTRGPSNRAAQLINRMGMV